MSEQPVTVNIHVLELLSSRICHDLISPVSAINNGIELFEELGPDAGEEVTDLIGHSAKQAARKLQLMRFAFGAGGNDPSIKPAQVFDAFSGFIEADNKVELVVPSPDRQMPLVGLPAINRIMACLFLLAHESMPRGGKIELTCDENSLTFFLQGVEEKLWNIAQDKVNKTQLGQEEAELDPKTIHPYVTGLFLRHYSYYYQLSDVADQSSSIIITAPAGQ
jgi:histidine phosphotransferase ChpT